ncbi:MAG: hypothetical protein V7K32_17650 [Nostoc sp.]
MPTPQGWIIYFLEVPKQFPRLPSVAIKKLLSVVVRTVLLKLGLTQTVAEKNDFMVGAIHELPLTGVVLRKS